jgi:hypothetical protein
MGKVAAFTLAGIACWFYSQDHQPPHFHAKRTGQWHARVFFLEARGKMVERVRGPRGIMSAGDREALCDMAELYREELLTEWEQKVV